MNLTINPLTANTSLTIGQKLMELLFIIKSTTDNLSAADFLTSLMTIKVKVEKTHPTYATKTIVYENYLLDLMEFASNIDGQIRVFNVGTRRQLRATLELSKKMVLFL